MYFSVIVPIYQVEPYLPQCVDSILAQTWTDFELILVDDGSPDGCPAICDSYREQDDRVTVIHKENGGLVSARQAGMAAARGDYVVHVDSDDWIAPGMLEEARRLLEAHGADLVTFAVTRVYPDHEELLTEPVPEGLYDRAALERDIFPKLLLDEDAGHMLYYQWGKAFRRDRALPLQMAVDRGISFGEDVACVVPYYLGCGSVYISHAPMCFCRQRPQSDSRTFRPVQFEQLALGLEGLQKLDCSAPADFPEQIARYGCFSCFVLLAGAARAGAFRQLGEIRAALDRPVFRRALGEARFRRLTPKTRAALFLLRRGWVGAAYWLLWACARIRVMPGRGR